MNKEIPINQSFIESRIFSIRNGQVMLDSDLADIYGVSTGRLNKQVTRNIDRLPSDFMFQITESEWQKLISQNVTSNQNSLRSQNAILESARGKHRKYLPYVFTKQGVAGLSGVLKRKLTKCYEKSGCQNNGRMKNARIHFNQCFFS